MTTTLGWGIIGCGDVVFKKSGPSILQADRSRIIGVMRRDPVQARAFAAEHSIDLCTDDADAVIGHEAVDIVYVATPPSTHRQYVVAAAEAGKHVLVEKPMGMSAAEDEAMIDACAKAGVELFVAYYRRFHPHVQMMKELLDAGRLGEPVSALIDYAQPPAPNTPWGGGWRVDPTVSGGGLFVDVVSHRIDVMVYLLGEPTHTCALRASPDPSSSVEQAVSVSTRFGERALCGIHGEFASPRAADRFVIACTEGVIDAGRLDGHRFSLTMGGETRTLEFDPFPAPHLGLIRHIERVLAGREANAVSGRQGLMTDRVIDRALDRCP